MLRRCSNLILLFSFALAFAGCAKKEPANPPINLPAQPVPSTPFVPPVVHPVRLQFNSGAHEIGTTTNAYKTRLSLGNNAASLVGTTTNGYRVQYNVQSPNQPR